MTLKAYRSISLLRTLGGLLLLSVAAPGEPIIPPSELFRDPKFVRDFVGSYGFLSDVEPKVTADEQAVLATVREMFEKSKFREAEAELARFVRESERPSDPQKAPAVISPAMVFVLANLYFQADRPDDARRAFLEAIRRFPQFRRAYTNLGYLYISQNKTEEAMPMLQRAVELGENSSRVYGLLGYCHLLKKNAVAAENAYRQAYLLDASSRDWKLGLAQALMAQEKFAESANLLGTLIEENPNDKQLWLQQTNAYLGMERKDDAIVNLEMLRLKGIADEANLTLLGNLHLDANEPQLALLAYLAATDLSKELDTPRTLKSAKILNDYGFPDKAASLIASIRERAGDQLSAKDQTEVLLAEVMVARTEGATAQVGILLARLMELNPADGRVLLELGRHKDALARDETNEEARATLVAEARTNYQLAARIDGETAGKAEKDVAYPANLALGQMMVRQGRLKEALTHLQAALNLKKSESLEQYVSRVRRFADREEDKKPSP